MYHWFEAILFIVIIIPDFSAGSVVDTVQAAAITDAQSELATLGALGDAMNTTADMDEMETFGRAFGMNDGSLSMCLPSMPDISDAVAEKSNTNATPQLQLTEQMDVGSQSSTTHPFLDYVPKPTRKTYFSGPQMVKYVNMMQKPASLAVVNVPVDQAQVPMVSPAPIFRRRLSVQPASLAVENVPIDQAQVPTVSPAPIRRRRISVQPPLSRFNRISLDSIDEFNQNDD